MLGHSDDIAGVTVMLVEAFTQGVFKSRAVNVAHDAHVWCVCVCLHPDLSELITHVACTMSLIFSLVTELPLCGQQRRQQGMIPLGAGRARSRSEVRAEHDNDKEGG